MGFRNRNQMRSIRLSPVKMRIIMVGIRAGLNIAHVIYLGLDDTDDSDSSSARQKLPQKLSFFVSCTVRLTCLLALTKRPIQPRNFFFTCLLLLTKQPIQPLSLLFLVDLVFSQVFDRVDEIIYSHVVGSTLSGGLKDSLVDQMTLSTISRSCQP